MRSIKVPKDIIVGIHRSALQGYPEYEDYFAEFKGIPCIGTGWNPDIEAILSLDPDVVFLLGRGGMGSVETVADKLESAGITVVRFYCNFAGAYEYYPDEITKLGYIFDKRNEADEFRDWYENILNTIKERVEKIPDEDKPKVYSESYHKPYYTSSQYTEVAGGKDIFEGISGDIDREAVIVQNPDIIVKMALGGDITGWHLYRDDTAAMEKVRGEVMSRPELQKVKAVKTGKVYVVSQYFATWGAVCGPRTFLQIPYKAKCFHPELFEELDPRAIHQEFMTRFHGLDIDLDEKGVFVYPEPS